MIINSYVCIYSIMVCTYIDGAIVYNNNYTYMYISYVVHDGLLPLRSKQHHMHAVVRVFLNTH